jgi:hypothetical protein
MGETAGLGDAENLRVFLVKHPKVVSGAIIYHGQEVNRLHEKVVALPLSAVLSWRVGEVFLTGFESHNELRIDAAE